MTQRDRFIMIEHFSVIVYARVYGLQFYFSPHTMSLRNLHYIQQQITRYTLHTPHHSHFTHNNTLHTSQRVTTRTAYAHGPSARGCQPHCSPSCWRWGTRNRLRFNGYACVCMYERDRESLCVYVCVYMYMVCESKFVCECVCVFICMCVCINMCVVMGDDVSILF
jgi:hypothetical protein